jgi:hypothetical protein
LIEESGRDVVLVMHSYGSCVGSEALQDDSLREKKRARDDRKGGVVDIVYVSAYMLPAGMTARDIFTINPESENKPEVRISILSYSNSQ